MQKPLAYLILGTPGSGRRELLADMIAESFDPEELVACLLSEAETASPSDDRLGSLSHWKWTADHQIEASLPEGCTTVFFVTNGLANPVDQLEAFRTWLKANDCELGRILCVVDSSLAYANPAALAWFDACIHFSDVILLAKRDGVPNKWMSDFIGRYEGQCYPCLFELVRKGRVKNPAAILDPQARRISLAFEEIEDDSSIISKNADDFIETSEDEELDDDQLDGGPSPEDEDDDDLPAEDPYFLRKTGGARVRPIPDITQFFPKP